MTGDPSVATAVAAGRLSHAAAAERASFATAPVWRRVLDDAAPLRESEELSFPAALLFADISGFTPLTARLAQRGSAGAEELSRLLNDYFGQLLALVQAHGGEPLKFAGDALFAIWPAAEGDTATATRRAAACGLAIQSRLFRYDAGGGVTLSMRVSVAQGRVGGVHMRAGDAWHFVVGGTPLAEAARAQAHAKAGETVLAASAREALAAAGCAASLAPAGEDTWRLDAIAEPPALRTRLPRWTPEALARLEGHVPEPIRARLAAGHGRWLADLRTVTVLFVQVRGLDHVAPGWAARLQAVVSRIEPLVHRFEGWLKEIVTDDKGVGLVVVFGVPPLSHEDDAARGARAALALDDVLGELGHAPAIGLTTGRCFCGVVGTDLRREYAVIGDAMNTAARLQEAASRRDDAPRLLGDAATRAAVGGAVDGEDLPDVTVKGKEAPLRVWRPRRSAAPRRIDTGPAIVGREVELATLRDAVARAAARGAPGSLLFVGEAGIGKSRLVAALCAQAAEAGVDVLMGGGDAIEAATPYFPWRQVFASLYGIDHEADPAARRAAIERWLGPEAAPRAPLLAALFALDGGDTPLTAALTGTARAHALAELLIESLAREAAAHPLAVVLENGHWFDQPSIDLLVEAGRRIAPLLVVATTRPEAASPGAPLAPLRDHACGAVLELGPLGEDHTLALARRRLGADALHPDVEALIRDRAAGHPFYAEQLASSLRETGIVTIDGGLCRFADARGPEALAIPDTMRGLVTSRIDRLPPREQLVLKVASVIGAAFMVRLLREIHPVQGDLPLLDSLLDGLCRASLTVRSEPEPDPAYAFNHVITHDVAYDLMLFAQRRMLHQAVAEWYERVFDDNRPELLGQLAHHWSRAGVVPKAVTYLEKAALRSFGMGFAATSVEQGLQAARLLGVTLPRAREDIVPLIGVEFQRIGELLAGRAPSDLIDGPRLEDAQVEAVIGVLLRMAPAVHVSGQGELFALVVLRCMSLTLEHGNGPMAPLAYAMYSIVYRGVTQDTMTALAFSRLSLDLDARQGRRLFSPVAFIHNYFLFHWVRPVEECLDMVIQAADAGFAADDLMYACFNNSTHVIYLLQAGRPLAEVMEVARRNYARNGRRVLNAAFHCVLVLQVAKALAGLTADGTSLGDAEYDEAGELASVLRSDMYEEAGGYCVTKARLHYLFQDAEGALDWIARALPLLPAFAGQPAEPDLATWRALALLARVQDGAPDAPARLAEAREVVDQIRRWAAVGEASFGHRLLLVEGELARAEGRQDEAAAALSAAADAARAMGRIHEEALAHERRARLLRALGDPGATDSADAAREAWLQWGADALADQIDRDFG